MKRIKLNRNNIGAPYTEGYKQGYKQGKAAAEHQQETKANETTFKEKVLAQVMVEMEDTHYEIILDRTTYDIVEISSDTLNFSRTKFLISVGDNITLKIPAKIEVTT